MVYLKIQQVGVFPYQSSNLKLFCWYKEEVSFHLGPPRSQLSVYGEVDTSDVGFGTDIDVGML